ncbi:P-loop containing nucleoside triphosphate hydrolase protein [Aulographum hederae CBS 113979]|uniref:Structural maintenance of chromosomes protein 5 n=1 Tax=Aulographum hederae CBS 113979 TaxID=1176131 RepID=A0A6G1HEH9_9PEZI|nr:P-loop containing nucleoside triphosphate hydrolase protein [Aulographum hederae CBS 113979]
MPGIVRDHQRYIADMDDDDEADENESDAQSSATSGSRGSKRQRMSEDPRSLRPSPVRNGESRSNGATRADEQHQPGSIVRVKMSNFVTYKSAEYHLGPSLNMVIGPNGTGKSTLVCAICLGLGFSPTALGRAKELGEFVKHGSSQAETEIELAVGTQHRGKNPIIRRTIIKEGNKSKWHLNGTATTHKAIMALVRSFSIQIDNLCQFLPQDRVVEFAALTPVQLLDHTQDAAAADYMKEWHETLKKLRVDQKTQQAEHSEKTDHLGNLQKRQEDDRPVVETMRDREKIQGRIQALEKFRPCINYRVACADHKTAKDNREQAQRNLKQLQRMVEPDLASEREKADYTKQVDKQVQTRRRNVDRAESALDALSKKHEEAEARVNALVGEQKAEKAGAKTRKQEIDKLTRQIKEKQLQQESESFEFNAAEYNQRIRDKDSAIQELKPQIEDKRSIYQEAAAEIGARTTRIKGLETQLEGLKTKAGKQDNKLKKISYDSFKAWSWIKKNKNLFENDVYGPPIVTCSVKDPQFADAIETILGKSDMVTFTTTSRKDFKMLQDNLMGTLSLHDITIKSTSQPLDHWKPLVDDQTKNALGLQHWAVDLLEGPEAVLSMLCDGRQLHRTGITTRQLNDQQLDRLNNSPIQQFVTAKQIHNTVRRREYGPGAVSQSVRQLKRATAWTDQPIDSDLERSIQRQISECQDETDQLTEKANAAKAERQKLGEQEKELQDERKEIEDEKTERQRAWSKIQALPTQIAAHEAKKALLEKAISETKQKVHDLGIRCQQAVLEKSDIAIRYAKGIENAAAENFLLYEAELWHIEAQSDLLVLKERNADTNQQLNNLREQVTQLEQTAQRTLRDAKRFRDEATRVTSQGTDEEQEVFHEFEKATMEDLAAEIESQNNRLAVLPGHEPGKLQEYKKRAKTIEKLEADVGRLDNALRSTGENIQELREKWEPELDALIGKISEAFSCNFQKIGCAGEVEVYKDEDFDQWSIRIKVKFRENEPLSILDSQRQSGGERAVSTVFYLMALQSLARSPFRVVDEINQGMDPRNERIVHERMVDIACEENTSQYFLVTPKLLNGLKFHRRMKVHCIMSGEHVPGEQEEWKGGTGALVERARAMVGAAA